MRFSELIEVGKHLIESGNPSHDIYREAIRCVQNLALSDEIQYALSASVVIYNELVKPQDSEKIIFEFHRDTDFLTTYAKRREPARGDGVAFLLTSGASLGHSSVLAAILREAPKPRRYFVFFLGKLSDKLAAEFDPAHVVVCPHMDGHLPRFDWLHEEMVKRGCGTLVWVSGGPLASFAMAQRIAEHQVFYAMRYHGMVSEHADQFLTLSGTREQSSGFMMNGRTWDVVPAPWPAIPPRGSAEAIARYTEQYQSAYVFGTVARQEKMSPAYLDCVCRILKRTPGSIFVWTGRPECIAITSHFEKAGLSHRHGSLGWVNPGEAIPSFDCFLETFPIGGVVTAQAMTYGVPAVFLNGATSVCAYAADDSLKVHDPHMFVDRAVAIYQSPATRDITVQRQAEFVEEQKRLAPADAQRVFDVLRKPMAVAA